jgi:hypothetical protein
VDGKVDKSPRELQEEDVLTLIRLGRAEGPTLEYKGELYERNERGSKEFLLDVCSMANSVGGYIFIGISELREDGQATGVPDPDAPMGLDEGNPEQILMEYEARILDCIDERILTESSPIYLSNGSYVLVFRVPNSLSKPHRVSYKGQTYFPARRERQRYHLTATEIKELVMRTASRIEIAEAQLQSALDLNPSNAEAPTLTVAVVPVFTRNFAVDFRIPGTVEALAQLDLTAQGNQVRRVPTHSIEGLVRVGPSRAYVVLGHSGLLRLSVELQSAGEMRHPSFVPLHIDYFARGIASGCGSIYASAGLTAPVLFGISLRIPTQCLASYRNQPWEDPVLINPFAMVYPSLVLDSLTDNIDNRIRPICDLVHQSLQEPSSRAFKADGTWRDLENSRR